MEKIYSIKDMHCNSCAQIIERALKDKVNKIYVSYAEEEAIIDFDSDKISEKEILDKIHKLGYEAKPLKSVQEIKQMNKIAKDISELKAETKKVESLEEEIEEKEQEIEEEIKDLNKFNKSIKSEDDQGGMSSFEKILLWFSSEDASRKRDQ